jgi:hypothetical protein
MRACGCHSPSQARASGASFLAHAGSSVVATTLPHVRPSTRGPSSAPPPAAQASEAVKETSHGTQESMQQAQNRAGESIEQVRGWVRGMHMGPSLSVHAPTTSASTLCPNPHSVSLLRARPNPKAKHKASQMGQQASHQTDAATTQAGHRAGEAKTGMGAKVCGSLACMELPVLGGTRGWRATCLKPRPLAPCPRDGLTPQTPTCTLHVHIAMPCCVLPDG